MAILAAAVVLSGCGQEEGPKVQVGDEKEFTAQVEHASSEIFDLLAVKGKATEPGAATVPCAGYPDENDVRQARHAWSLHGAPVKDLAGAMERLREQLPRRGWKIVKDGPDGSRARTPQIVADSADGKNSVDVRLLAESEESDKTSLIEVTVVSACYQQA